MRAQARSQAFISRVVFSHGSDRTAMAYPSNPYTRAMLFMVIEQFRGGDPKPVQERFRNRGRMLPEGVTYHASWIDPARARCFQVMEAQDASRLDPWIDQWHDLVDFDVVPVMASQEYWSTIGD